MPRRTLSDMRDGEAIEFDVALAVIGLYSAATDGEGITQFEEDALSKILSRIGLFEDYSADDFQALSETISTLIEEKEPEDLIASAFISLPNEEYREAAYVIALLVTSADDVTPEEEEDYLYELQEVLNISDERADEIRKEIFPEYDEEYDEEEEEE